jgi:two-component system LytT family response regulator
MLNVLIIDDEELSRETISAIVKQYCEKTTVVGEASSVREGLKAIKDLKPDVILLDIQLGDGSGFELLRMAEPVHAFVIFITAYEEYAIKAFKTAALDYLLKPVDIGELQAALNKARDQKQRNSIETQLNILLTNFNQVAIGSSQKIVLKTNDQMHILSSNEIMHIEAEGNYTKFYLVNRKTILVSKTLKEYEDILDKSIFVRIHQSHIVNMSYASRFDKRNGGFLILKDNTALPVSTRKKDDLIQYLEGL